MGEELSVIPDAEMAKINPNLMKAIAGDTFQEDLINANTSQGDGMGANAIGPDDFDGEAYNFEGTFQHIQLEGKMLECKLQGKKLPLKINSHKKLLTTNQ